MIETHGQRQTSAHYSRLGPQECEKIHRASIEMLEHVGVEVHDEKALDLLVKGGAKADGIVVRIPELMVLKALAVTPKNLTLFDQKGQIAIRATGYNSYFGGGSDCLNVLDHRTGQRRLAVLQDVVDAQRVQDALPEVSFVMSAFLPSDVNPLIYDRYQMEVMLNHTTKPIVFVSPDFEGCVLATEMAEIVAGGAEAFQRRPFATCYINVTDGLIANQEALQKCIYLAEKGLPQLYIPLGNGPHSVGGNTAFQYAGVLLGIVLAQLVREGSPVAVPGWGGALINLKTMAGSYGMADGQGLALAMGHYYGLPTFGMAGCTDSKVLDAQTGAEIALSLVLQTLEGANIIHDLGFMDSGMQGSLPLMAICNDWIQWIRHATAGVDVSHEGMALDVVHEVGPSGNYLAHPHTAAHCRDGCYPGLVDMNTHARWVEQGKLDMAERAARLVDRILEEHRVEPLPPDIQRDVHAVVEREVRRVGA
ncbi:MAG: trimethylamine methyltransferase family protein [Anaerolineae bacterium]|jgi:trimethylamine--corrinoid protein Co-methyltransferase